MNTRFQSLLDLGELRPSGLQLSLLLHEFFGTANSTTLTQSAL